MSAIATFDYDVWLQRYPEFTGTVDSSTAQELFEEAGIYCNNSGSGRVMDPALQLRLMNMLTAHLAFLYYGSSQTEGQSSPLVGRVQNANQGSVSLATQNDYAPGTPQWFQQTKYGSSFWSATAQFRTMRYVVKPRRIYNPPLWPVWGGGPPWGT